jgi:uncharacterized protein YydD (DUF2326 family)
LGERIAKIPKEVFPLEENVILDLDIGDEAITIKRNRKQADQPVIIREGRTVSFDKLQDAREYLTGLIFPKLNGKKVPSFRNLFSILMRDERSEFTDIIKCHDLTKKIPDDLSAHLFLLGFSLEAYKNTLETIKEIEAVNTVIAKDKKELTQEGKKKISDVKAELNALEDELQKLEDAIESFKTNETFDSMEADLIELEDLLDQLRKRQKALRYDYEKIRKMPKPEQIDDREIELVYNQFKSELGNAVVKSLNEVVGFKNKIEEFQRTLVNQKAKELESQLKSIAEQIRVLDDEYSEKLKVIDKKGVLKNLKVSLKIYEAKKDSISHTKFLFDQYEKNEKKKRMLNLQKTQQLMEIDSEIEQKSLGKTDIVIVDKIGVLRKIYSITDIAFVGGTLVNIGGHSLLEPLFYGKTPIFGPYLQNVKEISKEILELNLGYKVKDTTEFLQAIKNIEKNQEKSYEKIRELFKKNSRTADKIIEKLNKL